MMAIEQGQTGSEDCRVLMDSGSRVRTLEKRSLWRHVCCAQLMTVCLSVCLSVSCCLLMHMYDAHTSGFKDNEMKTPSIGMQKQTLESQNSEETFQKQKHAPFVRLTIPRNSNFSGKGYVPWGLTSNNLDHTKFFTLDNDGESLIVNRDGTYKLSLQIMYRGVLGRHYDEVLLWHEIHNFPVGYPKNLAMLIYMETVNFKSQTWRKTLFSEGVYSLQTGDRLKVFSMDRSLIDVGGQLSEKTFFVAHPHLVSGY